MGHCLLQYVYLPCKRCSFSTAVWATCHSSTSSSFRSILIWRSVSYPWRVFKSCSNVSKSALLEVADTVSEHKWSNSVSTQSCLHNASLEAIPTESCKGGLVGNKFLSTNVSSCLVNIGSRINQLNPKLGAYHVASQPSHAQISWKFRTLLPWLPQVIINLKLL